MKRGTKIVDCLKEILGVFFSVLNVGLIKERISDAIYKHGVLLHTHGLIHQSLFVILVSYCFVIFI